MKSVVIVGAGVIGLFCAVRLARAGARVTVLEAEPEYIRPQGPAASASAAGMLAPFSEVSSPHDVLAFASYDLWKHWQGGLSHDAKRRATAEWADGVRFDGGVLVASSAEGTEALLARATAIGRRAEALTAAQFRKRTGLRAKIDHTIFVEDEGVADPVRVLTGLLMQARAHGVMIEFNREAISIDANAVTAYEDDAVYEADAIVVACGFWGGERLSAFAPALRHVTPAKGHLVPITLDQPLWPNLRTPNFYVTQRREDVVLGATLEPGRTDRRVDEARIQELLGAANALLPAEVKRADHGWAGIRPMSPDGWPLIGPSGEVLVAAGHSRNGWLLAPVTAEIITAYVFGDEIPPAWAALSPARFETP